MINKTMKAASFKISVQMNFGLCSIVFKYLNISLHESGFAVQTEEVFDHGQKKRKRKKEIS